MVVGEKNSSIQAKNKKLLCVGCGVFEYPKKLTLVNTELFCEECMKEKEYLEKNKTIIVYVRGGLVQDIKLPKGIKVIVRDYDTDTCTTDELEKDCKKDDSGEYYMEAVWEN